MEASWSDKTEKLRQYFDSRSRYRMECSATGCDNREFSSELWRNVEEVIELAKQEGSRHPLEQFQMKKDVFYHYCEECDAGSMFK